jgi:predicted transcriptional regulator
VSQDKRVIIDLIEFDASIARGIADADAGRVHSADKVLRELREWIGRKAEARGR